MDISALFFCGCRVAFERCHHGAGTARSQPQLFDEELRLVARVEPGQRLGNARFRLNPAIRIFGLLAR